MKSHRHGLQAAIAALLLLLALPAAASAGTSKFTLVGWPPRPSGWPTVASEWTAAMKDSVITFSPSFSTDRTVFLTLPRANTAQAQLLRSTDGGASWTRVGQEVGLAAGAEIHLAMSPSFGADGTAVAWDQGSGSDRFWRTVDHGATWGIVDGPLASDSLGALKYVFSSDTSAGLALYCVANIATGLLDRELRLFTSNDAGSTWTQVGAGFPDGVDDLALSPGLASDHTLFYTYNGSVLRSSDGGVTWVGLPSPWPSQDPYVSLVLSPNYVVDHTVFAWTFYVSSGSIAKSTDSGQTWTYLSDPVAGGAESFSLSPRYPQDNTLFSGMYRSIDGGATWRQFGGWFRQNPTAVTASPDYSSDKTVYALPNGGFSKYTFASGSRRTLPLVWTNHRWTTNRGQGGTWYYWASFTLKISPGYGGKSPSLQVQRRVSGHWREYFNKWWPKKRQTLSLAGYSAYSVIGGASTSHKGFTQPMPKGRYRVRALVPADGDHVAQATAWMYLRPPYH